MSVKDSILVSAVLVLENDSEIIEPFTVEMHRVMQEHFAYYEILLLDNGSLDGSSERVQVLQKQYPNLRLIRLSRSYSDSIAYSAGLDNCLGDYVVLMDIKADPPALVPEMVDRALEGYDVVVGVPNTPPGRSAFRLWAGGQFYRIAGKMLGHVPEPNTSHFRVFSRQVVNAITKIRSRNRSLRFLNNLVGFRQTRVEYQRVYRAGGTPTRDNSLLNAALKGVELIFSNTTMPLRLASLLGVIASLVSFLGFSYVLVVSLVKRQVAEGWITTNLMSSTMFMLLFLILTVLSEYVAHILEETKNYPLYFVEYETSSTVSSFKQELQRERVNVV